MNAIPTHTQCSQPGARARRRRAPLPLLLCSLISVVSVTSLSGCAPSSVPSSAPVDAPRRASAEATNAPRPIDHGLTLVALDDAGPRLQQVSLRALLYNLIDDGDPPRFNDPQWPVVCGEQSSVRLDGRALEGGERVPDHDFTLDFRLDGACPLGEGGPLLFGRLHMLVVHDDVDGLVPVVLPSR